MSALCAAALLLCIQASAAGAAVSQPGAAAGSSQSAVQGTAGAAAQPGAEASSSQTAAGAAGASGSQTAVPEGGGTAASSGTAGQVPVSQTEANINGVQTLTQVFDVSPETDPASLQKAAFDLHGYHYTFSSITKEENETETKKTVTQDETVGVSSSKLSDALQTLPQTKEYEDEEGYKGTLTLQASSVSVSETGRTSHSGSKSVTKTYELPYSDNSQVPSSVTEDGATYTLTALTWAEGPVPEGSIIPQSYIATAVYTRGYTYTTVNGYQATATYEGEVTLKQLVAVRYTVTYTGELIEVPIPELPPQPQPEKPTTQWGTVLMWAVIALCVAGCTAAAILMLRRPRDTEGTSSTPKQEDDDEDEIDE